MSDNDRVLGMKVFKYEKCAALISKTDLNRWSLRIVLRLPFVYMLKEYSPKATVRFRFAHNLRRETLGENKIKNRQVFSDRWDKKFLSKT